MTHARALLEGLDILVVQDIFFTRTAQMADVVLPAAAAWCESEGTVTSSERRVQRVATGWETELRIAVDTLVPFARIFPLASAFYAECSAQGAAHTRLKPVFITIANIESRDVAQIIEGNERVVDRKSVV